MEIKKINISKLKPNANNPRVIKKDKFSKLKKSIEDFPEMLKLRPLIVDEDFIVLGGNMRLQALKELKIKEVYYIQEKDLNEEQKKQFIIKDNLPFGVWDWDSLANEWDELELKNWGLDVWQPDEDVDYSILDDINVDEEIDDLQDGIRKAIKIDFSLEDYPEAFELINKEKENGEYVGGLILELFKNRNNEH